MVQLGLKLGKYLLAFLFFVGFQHSCDKMYESNIPDVYVNFQIDLNIVNQLTIPGSSVTFPGVGYGGLIVTCYGAGEWYAFDASCTHEISRNCIVKEEGGIGECPCCGSQYVLIGGGYPVKGPSSMPLKQYHVSMVNPQRLRVYN